VDPAQALGVVGGSRLVVVLALVAALLVLLAALVTRALCCIGPRRGGLPRVDFRGVGFRSVALRCFTLAVARRLVLLRGRILERYRPQRAIQAPQAALHLAPRLERAVVVVVALRRILREALVALADLDVDLGVGLERAFGRQELDVRRAVGD